MRLTLTTALTVLALAFAAPAVAQTEAPAEGTEATGAGAGEPILGGELALGEPVDGEAAVGEPYVGAEFGDWVFRCVRTGTGDDPCQLYQLLSDQQGNSVAEISVFPLPAGQPAEAGVTIITPLETLLTEQVTMTVDGAQAKRYPFTFCAAVGCVSRIGLLAEEVQAFRAGSTAQIRIVPAVAPDQEVLLTVSLSGFTAGFNALIEGAEAGAAEAPAADGDN